ncbi:MAG TPA: HAD-IA family hydrolase [Patescibacteria group bacterium]|nr:HAD-IA family hydrolase [Patescibacteria group bacterium]
MSLVKDIIWDFDGTLFDTYPGTVNSFKKALEDNGIYETYENILNYIKVSEGCAITYFKDLYGLGEDFIDKYSIYKKNMEIEMVRPFPFAAEVCRQFVTLGGRNYIITHRGDSTLKLLQHYGMLSYFTEVITKRYEFKRKPDPEGFEYLIEKYNINKSTALVIGDRECEILGGKAVGIKTCLYNTNNVSLTHFPDFYIDSLKNLVDIIN